MQNIIMIPGLGAEHPGMGHDLYKSSVQFKASMDRLSSLAQRIDGADARDLVCNPSARPVAVWSTAELHLSHVLFHLCAFSHVKSLGHQPDAFLGCSLGELVCAILSGAITENEGLRLACEQAILFDKKSPSGGFLSIVGAAADYHKYKDCFISTWIAADNCNSNYVVAGASNELQRSKRMLENNDIFSVQLTIPHPYHTPLIDELKTEHYQLCGEFEQPLVPVYSAATGKMIPIHTPNHMWAAVRDPIYFRQLIERLSVMSDTHFTDCSVNGFLSNFVQTITKGNCRTARL